MNESASRRTTNQASVATPTADIEVLLVEDDPDDVTIMTRALFSSDFQIGLQVASNGREALDLLRKKGAYADAATPNLVLLDLNMPVMNGREFLEELRKDSSLHSIPVIVITTSDEPDVVREAYRFGANSVVTKANSIAGMTELMRLVTHYWFKTSRVFMVD
jgi:CheY-like chemotaxis protein